MECVLAAAAHRRAGSLARSRELVIEALSCGQRVHEQPTLAGALEQAAALHAIEGRHEDAMRLYGAAIRWRRTTEFMFDADDDAVTLTATALGRAEQEALMEAVPGRSLDEAAELALAELSLAVGPGPAER